MFDIIPTMNAEIGYPILKSEEFDQTVSDDPTVIRSDIVACTTMSLTRFLEDKAQKNQSTVQWLQTFPTRVLERGRWPFKREKRVYKVRPLEVLQDNRYYYGWQSGIADVLYNDYPEAASKLYAGKYAQMLYLGQHYPLFAPLITNLDLYDLIYYTNQYRRSTVPTHESINATITLLLKSLNSIEQVNEMLHKASIRQGVQVVYGGAELLQDLQRRGQANSTDVWEALMLPDRVSMKAVTVVLPIGEYEQKALLVK